MDVDFSVFEVDIITVSKVNNRKLNISNSLNTAKESLGLKAENQSPTVTQGDRPYNHGGRLPLSRHRRILTASRRKCPQQCRAAARPLPRCLRSPTSPATSGFRHQLQAKSTHQRLSMCSPPRLHATSTSRPACYPAVLLVWTQSDCSTSLGLTTALTRLVRRNAAE